MPTKESIVIESMFRVVNKASEDVDFTLNTAQREIDDNFYRRMILPKARQEGVSTYFLARSTVKCLGYRNTRAVVISHDAESTERMLMKVRYFLDHLKGPAPVLRNNSKNEITFPKTNSMFYIGTAGARAFGRGDTITDLHCSEVAYWPDPKQTMHGLLAAVPKATGCVSIESTGNGAGNWYHSQCMRAAKQQSTYKLLFLPWHSFPEYTLALSKEEEEAIMANLREDLREPDMLKTYQLTPGQLAWRRMIIEDESDGDLYLWDKEYPSTLDDCFQVAGGGVFQRVQFVKTNDWQKVDAHFSILSGHPVKPKDGKPGYHYVVGGDVAAGVRRDSSVAEVFCLETQEQVGEWISNTIEPDAFAVKLADIGTLFNEAYIGVESNNHGILTLKELTRHNHEKGKVLYPAHKVYRTPNKKPRKGDQIQRVVDLGVRTTSTSKPYIVGLLRRRLKDEWVIHSEVLKNELSTFIEKETGEMGAAEGCFDDTVMAAGMASFVLDKAAVVLLDEPIQDYEIPFNAERDAPFSLDGIIAEMTKGRSDSNKTFFGPTYTDVIH